MTTRLSHDFSNKEPRSRTRRMLTGGRNTEMYFEKEKWYTVHTLLPLQFTPVQVAFFCSYNCIYCPHLFIYFCLIGHTLHLSCCFFYTGSGWVDFFLCTHNFALPVTTLASIVYWLYNSTRILNSKFLLVCFLFVQRIKGAKARNCVVKCRWGGGRGLRREAMSAASQSEVDEWWQVSGFTSWPSTTGQQQQLVSWSVYLQSVYRVLPLVQTGQKSWQQLAKCDATLWSSQIRKSLYMKADHDI